MFPRKKNLKIKNSIIFLITSNGVKVSVCLITSLTLISTEPLFSNCSFLIRLDIYGAICSVNFNRIALTITNDISN
jgi:hypothetical protein